MMYSLPLISEWYAIQHGLKMWYSISDFLFPRYKIDIIHSLLFSWLTKKFCNFIIYSKKSKIVILKIVISRYTWNEIFCMIDHIIMIKFSIFHICPYYRWKKCFLVTEWKRKRIMCASFISEWCATELALTIWDSILDFLFQDRKSILFIQILFIYLFIGYY